MDKQSLLQSALDALNDSVGAAINPYANASAGTVLGGIYDAARDGYVLPSGQFVTATEVMARSQLGISQRQQSRILPMATYTAEIIDAENGTIVRVWAGSPHESGGGYKPFIYVVPQDEPVGDTVNAAITTIKLKGAAK